MNGYAPEYVRRVRRIFRPHVSYCTSFNPRTHAGCDFAISFSIDIFASVSIHAPTQGATYFHLYYFAVKLSFNPRTHAGCDGINSCATNLCKRFQSTHPRRVRQNFRLPFAARLCFNPRTHAGCDCTERFFESIKTTVSIHAPTQGATDS